LTKFKEKRKQKSSVEPNDEDNEDDEKPLLVRSGSQVGFEMSDINLSTDQLIQKPQKPPQKVEEFVIDSNPRIEVENISPDGDLHSSKNLLDHHTTTSENLLDTVEMFETREAPMDDMFNVTDSVVVPVVDMEDQKPVSVVTGIAEIPEEEEEEKKQEAHVELSGIAEIPDDEEQLE
jgi:hypothetical protein